jgi:hypothetical protein
MRSRSFRVGPANDDELLAVEPFGLAPPSTPVPPWLVVGLGGEPCRHVTLGCPAGSPAGIDLTKRGIARDLAAPAMAIRSNPLSSTTKSARTAVGSRRPQSLDY